MEKRANPAARAFATLALVGAAVIVIVLVASSLGGSSGSSNTKTGHGSHRAASKESAHRPHAASYTVEPGDTLTAIAHRTGVPVARILELNPEVDPQILIAGEELKLR
jgi:LysM repeat protein